MTFQAGKITKTYSITLLIFRLRAAAPFFLLPWNYRAYYKGVGDTVHKMHLFNPLLRVIFTKVLRMSNVCFFLSFGWKNCVKTPKRFVRRCSYQSRDGSWLVKHFNFWRLPKQKSVNFGSWIFFRVLSMHVSRRSRLQVFLKHTVLKI